MSATNTPSSIRFRSDSRSTARAASRSATGCRTSAPAWTTSLLSARCTPPTTTTPPRTRSTPAGIGWTRCSRPSARGCITAWAASTTTCRRSSSFRGPTRTDTRPSIGSYYLGPRHAGVPAGPGRRAAAVWQASRRCAGRGAEERIRPDRPTERTGRRRVSAGRHGTSADSRLRAGLPHADGRARSAQPQYGDKGDA